MTELAELLESVGDMAFTVSFRKKITDEHIMDCLRAVNTNSLRNTAYINSLTKELTEG